MPTIFRQHFTHRHSHTNTHNGIDLWHDPEAETPQSNFVDRELKGNSCGCVHISVILLFVSRDREAPVHT